MNASIGFNWTREHTKALTKIRRNALYSNPSRLKRAVIKRINGVVVVKPIVRVV